MNHLTPYSLSSIPEHGGDLVWASQHFQVPLENWLDLSTGINPYSYPIPIIAPADWHFLPTKKSLENTLDVARQYYNIPPSASLAIGTGSQSLIQSLAYLISPQPIAIISPTYSGHASAFNHAGFPITFCSSIDDMKKTDCRYGIVVNPNNPDGRIFDKEALLRLHQQLSDLGGGLILDEAFADTIPTISLSSHTNQPGLIILRSLGKFFGLAGVRIGFAIGSDPLIHKLQKMMGPWPIAGGILKIVQAALVDVSWVQKMQQQLNVQASAMDQFLWEMGIPTTRSTPLFCLVDHPDSPSIYQHLAAQGILLRAFKERPNWLRLGLLKTQDFDRFTKAYKS